MLNLIIAGMLTACGSGSGSSVQAGSPPAQGQPGSGTEGPISNGPVTGPVKGEEPVSPSPGPVGLSTKAFKSSSRTFAPMDMESQALTITFDAAARTATGQSLITFHQNVISRPTFLLDATIKSLKLNGENVSYSRVQDPDGQNTLVAIDREIAPGQTATLEVSYTLASDRVSFSAAGGVGFLTDMADTIGRFFEKWGPANFEDDQFAMTLRLLVKNSSSKHQVFGNGEIQQVADGEWIIRYPEHYTSTSMFAHLTNRALTVKRFTVQGAERKIPVVVYSYDASLVSQASAKIPGLFREIESDYGPYMHPSFIAYITEVNGGMEYVGGTITSLRSVSHELFHSWFARGVMPAEGRAGWIDEAIASWRDHGYQRAGSLLKRSQTNLANFSDFSRKTPTNSYADGRALLGEWDLLFAGQGGMRPLLRELYTRYKGSLLTTEEFRSFLEGTTGADLSAYFKRYVFGGDESQSDVETDVEDSLHPTPLTPEELELIR